MSSIHRSLESARLQLHRCLWKMRQHLHRGRDCSPKRGPQIGSLEPRILYSASPLASVVASSPASDLDTANLDEQGHDSNGVHPWDASEFVSEVATYENATEQLGAKSVSTPGLHLVLVDEGVEESDALIRGIANETNQKIIVVRINAEGDGMQQLIDAINAQDAISAVHLISHADETGIALGGERLNSDNLNGYAGQLATLRDKFVEDADFLIYGCNLASTSQGVTFMESIAALTGTDVAASDDRTGSGQLGGDWDFEVTVGHVQTGSLWQHADNLQWNHVLATINANQTDDVLNGDTSSIAALQADDGGDGISLREAVIAANNTGGGQHDILLGAGLYRMTIAGTGDSAGDLDVYSNIRIVGMGTQRDRKSVV